MHRNLPLKREHSSEKLFQNEMPKQKCKRLSSYFIIFIQVHLLNNFWIVGWVTQQCASEKRRRLFHRQTSSSHRRLGHCCKFSGTGRDTSSSAAAFARVWRVGLAAGFSMSEHRPTVSEQLRFPGWHLEGRRGNHRNWRLAAAFYRTGISEKSMDTIRQTKRKLRFSNFKISIQ